MGREKQKEGTRQTTQQGERDGFFEDRRTNKLNEEKKGGEGRRPGKGLFTLSVHMDRLVHQPKLALAQAALKDICAHITQSIVKTGTHDPPSRA